MLQTLELARENVLLRDEVNRLRGEIDRLARESTSLPCAPLVLILPRCRTQDYELLADRFAGVPSCEVVVDRRNVERRRRQTRPAVERRRTERRCGEGDAVALVVSVGSDRVHEDPSAARGPRRLRTLPGSAPV